MECVGINLQTGSKSVYCNSTVYGFQVASSAAMNSGLRGYFPPDSVGDAQPYLKPFVPIRARERQQESPEQHLPVRIPAIPPPGVLQFSSRRFNEDRAHRGNSDIAAPEQGPVVSAAEKIQLAYSIVDLQRDPAVTEQENTNTGIKMQVANYIHVDGCREGLHDGLWGMPDPQSAVKHHCCFVV